MPKTQGHDDSHSDIRRVEHGALLHTTLAHRNVELLRIQSTMKFTESFKTTLPFVSMRTAYDVDLDAAKNVEMDTSIGVDPNHQYGGWYETYDLESGGDRFYAGGILEVYWDDNGDVRLTGYDGCFELPEYITEALEKQGVIIDL